MFMGSKHRPGSITFLVHRLSVIFESRQGFSGVHVEVACKLL